MVVHKCPKCSKQFTHKSAYDYHVYKMKRKCNKNIINKCAKMNNEKCLQIAQKLRCLKCNKLYTSKYNLNRHILYSCNGDIIDIKNDKNSKFKNEHKLNDEKNICNYCNKKFTTKTSLYRHLRKFCKIRMKFEQEKEEIYQTLISKTIELKEIIMKQQEKIDKLEKQQYKNINVNKNSNNTINTQNNINIKLVAFGQEDLSYIKNNACKIILKKGFMSIPYLIEHVHFNKNRPDLHNVYIGNMRDKYAMVFNGNQWSLQDRNTIIDQLYDDKKLYLEEKYEDLKNDIDDITNKKFKRFIDFEDDQEKINEVKKDIKLLLYNKRNIPLSSKKNFEIK